MNATHCTPTPLPTPPPDQSWIIANQTDPISYYKTPYPWAPLGQNQLLLPLKYGFFSDQGKPVKQLSRGHICVANFKPPTNGTFNHKLTEPHGNCEQEWTCS